MLPSEERLFALCNDMVRNAVQRRGDGLPRPFAPRNDITESAVRMLRAGGRLQIAPTGMSGRCACFGFSLPPSRLAPCHLPHQREAGVLPSEERLFALCNDNPESLIRVFTRYAVNAAIACRGKYLRTQAIKSVIANQCAHWCGNPYPLGQGREEIGSKGERIAASLRSSQ